ncbi:hypothetical protein BH23ACT9_BH23ACT9_07000 [soil metagenome]
MPLAASALAITAPGGGEIALIVFLALLLFGGRKLPELGSSVGKTITNFRKGIAEAQDEEDAEIAATADPADAESTDKS